MAANINNLNIELLNLNNYHTWKYGMITLLQEKEVLKCIHSEFNEEDFDDSDKKELNELRRMENKCKSIIVQCIDDSQIDIVRDKVTAYSMWKVLEERYEKKGIPEQLMLRKKLMCMKLKENEDLESFLKNYEGTLRQLKATGAELKEEDLVCNLLLAMPNSFQTVITVLENIPASELTFEMVKSKLRSEMERRKASTSNSNTSAIPAVFVAGQRGRCYTCGQRGHYMRNCRRGRQYQQRGPTREEQQEFYRRRGDGATIQRGRTSTNYRRLNMRGRNGNYTRNYSHRSDRRGNYVEYEEDNQEDNDREEDNDRVIFMTGRVEDNVGDLDSVMNSRMVSHRRRMSHLSQQHGVWTWVDASRRFHGVVEASSGESG